MHFIYRPPVLSGRATSKHQKRRVECLFPRILTSPLYLVPEYLFCTTLAVSIVNLFSNSYNSGQMKSVLGKDAFGRRCCNTGRPFFLRLFSCQYLTTRIKLNQIISFKNLDMGKIRNISGFS